MLSLEHLKANMTFGCGGPTTIAFETEAASKISVGSLFLKGGESVSRLQLWVI